MISNKRVLARVEDERTIMETIKTDEDLWLIGHVIQNDFNQEEENKKER